MESVRVLIVDDNAMYREAFARNMLLQGYDVLQAEHGEEALKVVRAEDKPLVIFTAADGSPLGRT